MKAEHKFNKGKGKGREVESDDGQIANRRADMPETEGLGERHLNKQELERQRYGSREVVEGGNEVSGTERDC